MPSTGIDGNNRRGISGLAFGGAAGPPVVGYFAWYDASQITGVADGATLATWPDKSANGYNLSQANGAKQPTFYKTTAAKLVNGLPAVWFSTAPTSMVAAGFPHQATFSAFSVFIPTPAPSGQEAIWYDGQGSATGLYVRTGDYDYQFVNKVDTVTLTPSTTVASVCAITNDGTTGSLSVNGGTAATNNAAGGVGATLTVGTAPGGSLIPFAGPICELLFYPSALSGANVTSVVNYLTSKWG